MITRLHQKPLQISDDETGFLKGKWISENIRLLDSVIKYRRKKDSGPSSFYRFVIGRILLVQKKFVLGYGRWMSHRGTMASSRFCASWLETEWFPLPSSWLLSIVVMKFSCGTMMFSRMKFNHSATFLIFNAHFEQTCEYK